MAAWVVADSGIILATVLEETYSEKARALIAAWKNEGVQLAAPELFRYEVVAVMRKAAWQNRLTSSEALEGIRTLLALPIQFHIDSVLLQRAYELATRFNRPTAYDSQYLAVAEQLGGEFWTADERLFNAVKADLGWVKWLGNFSPPSSVV